MRRRSLLALTCIAALPQLLAGQSGGPQPPGPIKLYPGLRVGVDSATTRVPTLPWATSPQPAQDSALTVSLFSNLESRLERNRNNRCDPSQSYLALATCKANFQPLFDFNFNLLASGVVARRVQVGVDYDSEREFDASNDISVAFRGDSGKLVERLELGSVSFAPPQSRFITSGIPSGNYGFLASGWLGPLRYTGIAAQQRGRTVLGDTFTVGDLSTRTVQTDVEDYRFEERRFFFTIDPSLLPGYPNIDILNTQALLGAAQQLPDTLRPTRVYLYRLLLGGQPSNPSGPQFIPRGARNQNRGPVYEYLREGVDYYADPSLLWVALVRQLRRDERLVVAYNVLLPDGTTVYPGTGGTPALEYSAEPQFANVLWDPELQPADAAFNREIRAAYRIAGEELIRAGTQLRIVTSGSGQEKPAQGPVGSYLQLFGMGQPQSGAQFDEENRIWPRIGDANFNRGIGGEVSPLMRLRFAVFPSLKPFASTGLATPGNPSNDTLYTTPAEDVYSSRRPQSIYTLQFEFQVESGGQNGSIALGSIQIRRNSERITVDGVPVTRDVDYSIDYDLGQVQFNRPDTLFATPRRVAVQFEENPLFAETPTSIFALHTQLPLSTGSLNFTAIRQNQRSTFSRPTLGFEPTGSLVAGISGEFEWDATGIFRQIGGAGAVQGAQARLRLGGELALSRPDPNSRNVAYLESFRGETGVNVPIDDSQWYTSSRPASSALLPDATVATARATTLAWQSNVLGLDGSDVTFRSAEIDPNARTVGLLSVPEPLLWLTLYPLAIGGVRNALGAYDWTVSGTPGGSRWRSIFAPLGAGGADLTRVEQIQFWALVDTAAVSRNPRVVIDLGEISENSLNFAPDTMRVSVTGSLAGYRGRRIQGDGVLDSERDSFSRAFDASVNDVGLPGDVADRLVVVRDSDGSIIGDSLNAPICVADRRILTLGDSRANCTVRNARLDEEDIDRDGVLNFSRDAERLFRFVINLADKSSYERVGGCIAPGDARIASNGSLCWVHVRVPFRSPHEIVGAPLARRIKAIRLTVVSGDGLADSEFSTLGISRINLTGPPWSKRSDLPLVGLAGETPAGSGYVVSSLIGSADSTAARPYQPPPGVLEQAENSASEFEIAQVLINEKSLRLQAGGLELNQRAEAFYRFPEGQKSFMAYRQLRLWMRGRNSGWGSGGELNYFVRLGRDQENFYLYRGEAQSGQLQSAWEPEVVLDFQRFFALRARLQNELLSPDGTTGFGCTAVDSALVMPQDAMAASVLRFACDGPYMIVTRDAAVSPPSLSSIQELAVGMVRVGEGGGNFPIMPQDTLELWVDEVRLTGVVKDVGYAGAVYAELVGGDLANVRVSLTHRDRNFRQLAESPTFSTDDAVNLTSTFRLDRMAGVSDRWVIPLTVSHSTSLSDPYFIPGSDIPGGGIAGLRTPRDASTRYSVALRRLADGSSLAQQVLGSITLRGSLTTDDARSAYLEGSGNSYSIGADLNWMRDRGNADAAAVASSADINWIPTQVRFSSGVSRNSSRRSAFLSPAAALLDTGRTARALDLTWRNGGMLEFRPAPNLLAQWELTSLRDLRDYGDTSAVSRAATEARASALGADVGMERQRTMRTLLNYSAPLPAWLRSNFSFSSTFLMLRDPNSRFLVGAAVEDTGDGVLPRRLNGTQQFRAGLTLDPASLAGALGADSAASVAIGRRLTAIDIAFTRTLRSAWDRADFMPDLAVQFGLAGTSAFRQRGDSDATSSGVTHALSLGHTLALPAGISLTHRFVRSTTRSWNSVFGGLLLEADGVQVTYPNLLFRMNLRPVSGGVLASVNAQAELRKTVRDAAVIGIASGPVDRTRDEVLATPASVALSWNLFGGFTTAGSIGRTEREDLRPGIRIDGTERNYSADVRKVIPAGTLFNLERDLRTRVSVVGERVSSDVISLGSGVRSRLRDNGRRSLALTADTDVNETMTLSVSASETVTYDRNLNRRFTQTLLSVVLRLDFFAGVF